MPLYSYSCLKCDEEVEEIQKFSDPPLTIHEECGGELVKNLTTPNHRYKGEGWGGNEVSPDGGWVTRTINKKPPKPEYYTGTGGRNGPARDGPKK